MGKVVELRIMGVGGATAEETLGTEAKQVSGDKLAGFHVPEDPEDADESAADSVEVYEWGRLTSGDATTALWWVLLPFTLFNAAGWLFRPTDYSAGEEELAEPDSPGRSTLWWGRLIVVGGGTLMTSLFLLWIGVLAIDLWAIGCANAPECLEKAVATPLRWFGADPTWQLGMGILLTWLVMFGLLWLGRRSQQTHEYYERDPVRRAARTRGSRLARNTNLEDPRFWYQWKEYRRLWRWHLATVAVTLGGLTGYAFWQLEASFPEGKAGPMLILLAAVTVFGGYWVLSIPERRKPNLGKPGDYQDDWGRVGIWTTLYTALTVGSAFFTHWLWPARGWERVDANDLNLMLGVYLMIGVMFVVALPLLFVLWLRHWRAKGARGHQGFRKGGPFVAGTLAIFLVSGGMGGLGLILGKYLLGTDALVPDPDTHIRAGAYDTMGPDILLLAIIIVAITALLIGRIRDRADKAVKKVMDDFDIPEDPPPPPHERRWIKRLATARRKARIGRSADRLVTSAVWVMIGLLAIHHVINQAFIHERFYFSADATTPFLFGQDWLSWFHTAASFGVVLFIFPGVQTVRWMLGGRKTRRQLSKVFDVLSFWPRRFHPLGAPCYADRAVPEFRERIRHYGDRGHRVMISAHSQGTVIALAAILQLRGESLPGLDQDSKRPDTEKLDDYHQYRAEILALRDGKTGDDLPKPADPPAGGHPSALGRTGLMTYGCPLSDLYARFFPAYFGTDDRFKAVRAHLAKSDDPLIGRTWLNLYRDTDYIGRKVFVCTWGTIDKPYVEERILEVPKPTSSDEEQQYFEPQLHSNYEKEQVFKDWQKRAIKGLG